MPNSITLENLDHYTKYFNKLKKAGLTFEIHKQDNYNIYNNSGYYELSLHAMFKNVRSLRDMANIWTIAHTPISLDAVDQFSKYIDLDRNANCSKVSGELYQKNNPSVRFYAKSVFDNNLKVNIYIICGDVPEITHDGHTIRTCTYGNTYNGGKLVCCADETHPIYNYIDKGHALIYISSAEPSDDCNRVFATDMISLDMNYIIAAALIYPPAIDGILQNGAFIPSKDCRLALLRVEKAIPTKLRDNYLVLKKSIQEDFSKNTASIMIGKLTRKESPFIDLNGIRITSNRAEYKAGNVSIEAANLAEVVFTKLNPNEVEWDIFTLINIYTDWVNDEFNNLPLSEESSGFVESKEFKFKINDIPLTVGCSTKHTRRSINNHLINVTELSSVLKRAACYQVLEDETEEDNIKNFDRFITDVSRYSLKLRDIWANGLPVKTVFLESDKQRHGAATMKHPKLRFILKDKKGFHLQVNTLDAKDKSKIIKTDEFRIGKFAEFVKKVEQLNKDTRMGNYNYAQNAAGYYTLSHEDPRLKNFGAILSNLLEIYAEDITEDAKKGIIGVINYELSEAEKKSEELLKEACDLTKTTKGKRNGKNGFIVPGKMRTYFVEEEGAMKVWDNDPNSTNPYFCVVNRGNMGIGRDALVARIFALSNDDMMAKQIHTLKR